MNKFLKIYSTYFLLSLSVFSFAQQHSIEIAQILDEQDNTPNSTSCFIQDNNGFIWIGTIDGLLRYDGYNFKTYRYDKSDKNSISNNIIRSLEVDKSGILWIGTQGGGLNRYNPETGNFTSYRNNIKDSNSLCNNNVGVLHCDKNDNLWIGTWDNGLDKFDKKTETFKHYEHLQGNENTISGNEIREIFEDKEGFLWIGTLKSGLNKLNTKTNNFKHYKVNSSNKSLANNSVYAICEDHLGVMWIGTTGGGLQRMNKKTGEFTYFKKDKISDIIFNIKEKKDGTLAVATDKGLYLILKDRNTLLEITTENYTNLKTNRLRNIFIDKEDNLWIGTEVGANRLIENTAFVHFIHQQDNKNSLAGKIIRSVCEDKAGDLWIGTLGQGLNKYDSETGKISRIKFSNKNDNLLGSEITSMYEDSLGNFWIGCWGKGLFLFDRNTNKVLKKYQHNANIVTLTDNRIQSIIEEKKGVLWISTENGMNRFDYLNQIWTNFYYDYDAENSVSGNKFQSKALVIDKNGVVWAGTWANGLNAIIPTKNAEIPYKFLHWKNSLSKSNSIRSNSIISLLFDKKDNLWIGTYGGGINFVAAKEINNLENQKLTFKNYTTDNGLINNIIYGILEDKQNNIWFSTDKGLSAFKPSKRKFINYNINDGLINNQLFWGATASTESGKLYFGSVEGLNLVFPEKIKKNQDKLHLEIVDIHFLDESKETEFKDIIKANRLSSIKNIELSREEASFTLKYIALNYKISDKIKYAYKLEGLDKKWNYVENRRETNFNNLAPGIYHFKLKARNINNIWTEEQLLTITVLPPWWDTWLFKIGAFLVFISLAASFYFYRINKLKTQKQKLELKVEKRTRALFKKNKQLKIQYLDIAKQKEEAELQKQKTELINKELNDFAYIISHDLKAPLRGINQLATWISTDYADKFDKDGKEQMQMLIGRVKTMDGMVDGVLQYSRTTNFTGDFQKINLTELIGEIIVLILPPEHIEIIIDNELPEIKGDRVRIMQVFQNLISNALKFMDKSEGYIKISYSDENTHWQFNIEDNGEGIEEKHHENIFKIFQTVNSNRKDSTGIGLSIVKKIVRLYKGKIWLESELGKGSKFSFTIAKKIK